MKERGTWKILCFFIVLDLLCGLMYASSCDWVQMPKLNLFMAYALMINDHWYNIPGDILLNVVTKSTLVIDSDSHEATPTYQWRFIHRIQRNAHGHNSDSQTKFDSVLCCLRLEMRYRHTYESECKAHMVQHIFRTKSLRYKYVYFCLCDLILYLPLRRRSFFGLFFFIFFFSFHKWSSTHTHMLNSFSCCVSSLKIIIFDWVNY